MVCRPRGACLPLFRRSQFHAGAAMIALRAGSRLSAVRRRWPSGGLLGWWQRRYSVQITYKREAAEAQRAGRPRPLARPRRGGAPPCAAVSDPVAREMMLQIAHDSDRIAKYIRQQASAAERET